MKRTAFVIIAALVAGWVLTPVQTLVNAQAAGLQFENSDFAYLASSAALATSRVLIGLLAFLSIVLIWWKPIVRAVAAAAAAAVLLTAPAQAYYDKQDFSEAVTVYPNETAFWIPDNGGNKDSQGKMDSAAYYDANKVPLKRFVVPHAKFSGSGTWSDYYVPAGRLILVDRTPYNREWVAAGHRGTSERDQSFPCQSSEGLDVTAELTIGTSVFEQDAAKFLYRFGVKPPAGDRRAPEVTFTSVYYGRSLTEVMDTVGRGTVQALVCSEISTRPLDGANTDAAKMLEAVRSKAAARFAEYGITLDYIGWAGTFAFGPKVQDALDRQFVAAKDAEIAKQLAPHTTALQAIAMADAIRKFDGKLPGTLVGGIAELLRGVTR